MGSGGGGGVPTTTAAGVGDRDGFCNRISSAGEMLGEAGGAVVIICTMP